MTSTAEGQARGAAHLALARDYAQAAHGLRLAGLTGRPFWMLIGHALELSLKALLLTVGFDEARVMTSVNHHLWSAMRLVRDQGMELGEDIVALIETLDAPHAMQTFRYPSLLDRPIPIDPHVADTVLAGHLRRIGDPRNGGVSEGRHAAIDDQR